MNRDLDAAITSGRARGIGVVGIVAVVWIAVAAGCASERQAEPATSGLRPGDLVGSWHLVSAAGNPPSSLNVKSVALQLASDGSWTSQTEMGGPWAGMVLKASGTWFLDSNGLVRYTAGNKSGASSARLKESRLVLSPDFILVKDGTVPVDAEYER